MCWKKKNFVEPKVTRFQQSIASVCPEKDPTMMLQETEKMLEFKGDRRERLFSFHGLVKTGVTLKQGSEVRPLMTSGEHYSSRRAACSLGANQICGLQLELALLIKPTEVLLLQSLHLQWPLLARLHPHRDLPGHIYLHRLRHPPVPPHQPRRCLQAIHPNMGTHHECLLPGHRARWYSLVTEASSPQDSTGTERPTSKTGSTSWTG
jgi:hypothetical protein